MTKLKAAPSAFFIYSDTLPKLLFSLLCGNF